MLFEYLVVIMAIGLTTTIVLGILLAFRSVRNRWMIVLSLALGLAVPVALLWLGHKSAAPRPPPAQASAP
jgi:cyanate permease